MNSILFVHFIIVSNYDRSLYLSHAGTMPSKQCLMCAVIVNAAGEKRQSHVQLIALIKSS